MEYKKLLLNIAISAIIGAILGLSLLTNMDSLLLAVKSLY